MSAATLTCQDCETPAGLPATLRTTLEAGRLVTIAWCRVCRPLEPPAPRDGAAGGAVVVEDQVDDRAAVLYPPAPAHWFVDALRAAPRPLVWGSGFAFGLLLIGADRLGAIALEHLGFRLVGL